MARLKSSWQGWLVVGGFKLEETRYEMSPTLISLSHAWVRDQLSCHSPLPNFTIFHYGTDRSPAFFYSQPIARTP